jgi:hypothetical protein
MTTLDKAMMDFLMPIIEKIIEEKIQSQLESRNTEPVFTFNDELPLTTELLAERMGLSKSFLYQEVSKKNIPFHKRCGRLYYIPSEIRDWVMGKWKKGS